MLTFKFQLFQMPQLDFRTCRVDIHMLKLDLLQVVVVMCERDLQLQRLMETRHLSERESILLIDAQMAQEEKAAR